MGTERATELLNKLLADFHAEEHKKNVELAARPDAAKIGATLQNALAGALEREQQLLRRIREHEHERYQVAKP